MAHPKRKISKTRRDKRRTHYKASSPQLATCPTTGVVHIYHRAYYVDGRGILVFYLPKSKYTTICNYYVNSYLCKIEVYPLDFRLFFP